eukprot:TRINITY_DN7599_c0_g1_i1.p1 TRINITY_DN7599_c0_g1~~TRINITY_DN7599_c0_g1_i1.p1  ORF type:complete len:152 (+),score=23.54 TRINITY_DN7599_c0_g1_i1:314-769(+)
MRGSVEYELVLTILLNQAKRPGEPTEATRRQLARLIEKGTDPTRARFSATLAANLSSLTPVERHRASIAQRQSLIALRSLQRRQPLQSASLDVPSAERLMDVQPGLRKDAETSIDAVYALADVATTNDSLAEPTLTATTSLPSASAAQPFG